MNLFLAMIETPRYEGSMIKKIISMNEIKLKCRKMNENQNEMRHDIYICSGSELAGVVISLSIKGKSLFFGLKNKTNLSQF